MTESTKLPPEGASVDLFAGDSNRILIAIPAPSHPEVEQVLGQGSHQVQAGVIYRAPALLLSFDFGNGLVMDCPFEAKGLGDKFVQPELTDGRLPLMLQVFDAETGALLGERPVELHQDNTATLMAAVAEQRSSDWDHQAFIGQLSELYKIDMEQFLQLVEQRPLLLK
ncbi:hypothetical protein FCL40_04285 [Ferrimonas sediminicola]|uniref:Uncharacterized protein n=1 Tax=Ferrimonas sediminicola TaxID=2569538 RepID=A0A4U1BIJ2_9GAMM|nr:hypothetical protein [Ferrimonas sediminicola]TKB50379.1 hypothetical protein FCL40_04285 [Ferrimonas sediminicola]